VIASLAFAYSVWAIWGSGEEWLAKGFMLLLLGIPVYVWLKWRTKPEPVPEVSDFDRAIFGRPVLPLHPAEPQERKTPVGLGLE
jgi:hypothetical protein